MIDQGPEYRCPYRPTGDTADGEQMAVKVIKPVLQFTQYSCCPIGGADTAASRRHHDERHRGGGPGMLIDPIIEYVVDMGPRDWIQCSFGGAYLVIVIPEAEDEGRSKQAREQWPAVPVRKPGEKTADGQPGPSPEQQQGERPEQAANSDRCKPGPKEKEEMEDDLEPGKPGDKVVDRFQQRGG